MNHTVGIGVDHEVDFLSRTHVAQLRLLEVRGDPNAVGHERHGCDAGLGVLADSGGELRHLARLQRRHARVGDVELRLLDLRQRLAKARLRARPLRLQDVGLRLLALQRRFRLGEIGLALIEVRRRLLRPLRRSRPFVRENARAPLLGRREGQRRNGLRDLRDRLVDLRALRGDLGVIDADLRARRGGLRTRLVEGRLIITSVDLHYNRARRDPLVVLDGDGRDVARDLWREPELARVDESIVGLHEAPRLAPVDESGDHGADHEKQSRQHRERVAMKKPFARSPLAALLATGV